MEDRIVIGRISTIVGYSLMGWFSAFFGVYYYCLKRNMDIIEFFESCNLFFLIPYICSVFLFMITFFVLRQLAMKRFVTDKHIEECRKVSNWVYFGYGIEILIVLYNYFKLDGSLLYLAASFILCFEYILSVVFLSYMVTHGYERTGRRMSFNIFYPSILSIAVNMHFGYSLPQILSLEERNSKFWSILICSSLLCSYFLVVILGELLVSKLRGTDDQLSTKTFSGISIFYAGLFLSIYSYSYINQRQELSEQLNILGMSIIIALFFSVFESWDATAYMEDEQLLKNVKTINQMIFWYPCIVSVFLVFFPSTFFSVTFALLFYLHSILVDIVWINGNSKGAYSSFQWGREKVWFGGFAIVFMMVSLWYPGYLMEDNVTVAIALGTLLFTVIGVYIIVGINPFKNLNCDNYSIMVERFREGSYELTYITSYALQSIIVLIGGIVSIGIHSEKNVNQLEPFCESGILLCVAALSIFYFLKRSKLNPRK